MVLEDASEEVEKKVVMGGWKRRRLASVLLKTGIVGDCERSGEGAIERDS